MESKSTTKFTYFIVILGILSVIVTELISGSMNLWYIIWFAFPYCAYYLAARKALSKTHGAIIGGGVLILGIDILIRGEVLFSNGSSTDSIALLTMPFWLSVVIMPIGFLLGWLIEKLIRGKKEKK